MINVKAFGSFRVGTRNVEPFYSMAMKRQAS